MTAAAHADRAAVMPVERRWWEGPLVSAVITTYNYARFIPEAIESVLAQTYENLEIIVIDDGSTDDTRSVVESFASRGVRYFYQSQSGPGPARNAALKVTRGSLIGYLDADDAWLSSKTEVQVDHLLRHPELAMVGGDSLSCDETMAQRGYARVPRVASGYLFESLLLRNIVHNPSSVLIRRPALEAVGGFSDVLGEDWDTWIRIAKNDPIGFVDVPVARYRRHMRSVSPRAGRFRIDGDRAIVERHLSAVSPARRRRLVRRRAFSLAYMRAARTSLSTGDKASARRLAALSMWWDPIGSLGRKAALVLRAYAPKRLVDTVAPVLKQRLVERRPVLESSRAHSHTKLDHPR